ncbi:hypothetical protein D9M72_267820 [compost metagenome]
MGLPLRSSAHSSQVASGLVSFFNDFSMRPSSAPLASAMRISALASPVLSSTLRHRPTGVLWAMAETAVTVNKTAASVAFMSGLPVGR